MAGQRLHFIGVTTSGSRIMDLFPIWAEVLGLDAEIVGRDVDMGAPPERYREVVSEIAGDPASRGALVTTHKVSVVEHAAELFAELDYYAELLREVSCISRDEEEGLVGHAKDPITAGRSLEAMLGAAHWSDHSEAEVLCMGAGGAGTAITVRLVSDEPHPGRITVTDRDPDRLEALDGIVGELSTDCDLEVVEVEGPEDHDRLVGRLPSASLVVNATGMGKDIPGTPLSERATFPEGAVVWELNYRGPRPFLQQARQQAEEQGLDVHDGWLYFLHGWTEVIAEVFRIELSADRFADLAEAAEPFRPA